MATQTFMESEATQINALMRTIALSHSMQELSSSKAAEWNSLADDLPARRTEDGDCLVGLSVALAMEAAMAFGLYAVWQVWHLIR